MGDLPLGSSRTKNSGGCAAQRTERPCRRRCDRDLADKAGLRTRHGESRPEHDETTVVPWLRSDVDAIADFLRAVAAPLPWENEETEWISSPSAEPVST